MNEKPRVLSVDDDPTNQELIRFSLKDDYDVEFSMSGEDALELLAATRFDIVLLDVSMAGMNGYQVCEAVRKMPDGHALPVLFVSALCSLEDRIQGYQAGGDDYISKPILPEELKHKMDLLIQNKSKYVQLDEQLQFATTTAMTAMTNSGEMGVVLQFVEASFSCESYESIAAQIVSSNAELGLISSLQIRAGSQHLEWSTGQQAIKPLEAELLTRGQEGKRIVELGTRCLFNSEDISILIKNMPLNDPDKVGRLRDHIALILKSAEARVRTIKVEEKSRKLRRSHLAELLETAQNDIGVIEDEVKMFQDELSKILNDLMVDVEDAMIHMSLTEEQERHFLALVEESRDKVEAVCHRGIKIDDFFTHLNTKLCDALEVP